MNISIHGKRLSVKYSALAGLICILSAPVVMAADQAAPGNQSQTDTQPLTLSESPLKASEMIGKSVKNAQDEDLGSIEDIALDSSTGEVLYVVLSTGLISNKLYAVPVSALSNPENDEDVMLDITQEQLDSMSSFEDEKWPTMANEEFSNGSSEFSKFQEATRKEGSNQEQETE